LQASASCEGRSVGCCGAHSSTSASTSGDAGAISVDDYTASRSLALALHQEFPDLDGVAYRSRYDNGEICFGVFDRVNASDRVADRAKRFDATPARVDELMSRYVRVVRYECAGSSR